MSALSYLSPKAEVRPSAIHGRGLFAREPIAKGDIVCVKGGHIFDRQRLAELQPDLGPAEVRSRRTSSSAPCPGMTERAA